MRSFSEIETTVKRATKAIGFSWGIAEEVGKNVRLLEMFGLPGLKNINQYYHIPWINNMNQLKSSLCDLGNLKAGEIKEVKNFKNFLC